MKRFYLLLFLITSVTTYSQNDRIILDEDFSDWESIGILYSDPIGDQSSGIIDFQNIWITNDEDYLFLSLEVGGEINFQNDQEIIIYIDLDNNVNTGMSFAGIGAEIVYNFGDKEGQYWKNGESETIWQSSVGLVSSPTVTSTQFEFLFNLNSQINGNPIFIKDSIKVVLKDMGAGSDQLPDSSGGIAYNFTSDPMLDLPPFLILKENENHLRVLSYNVERDALWDNERFDAYKRIFEAIDPDIIAFQEIYDHSSQETVVRLEEIFPSPEGKIWYHAKRGYDLILLSRFPITSSYSVGPSNDGQKSAAHLVNLRPKYNSDLLYLNAHPKCCGGAENDARRQRQADAQMAFVRNAKEDGGTLTLAEGTPIIISGDMNYVGSRQQPITIVTGDILDNSTYGSDFNPDWDEKPFVDSKVLTSNMPLTFTWYSEGSYYPPGRLDYLIYSSSVLEKVNGYSLFTKTLTEEEIRETKLHSSDVLTASDHLPVVVDFELKNSTNVEESSIIPSEFKLGQNYPNPFNSSTTINYSIPEKISNNELILNTKLVIYDTLGRNVAVLVDEFKEPGEYSVTWNLNILSSGTYFYQINSGDFVATKKMVLLR